MLHGFAILDNPPPTPMYAICAEYKIDDGVSWEHWWVEVGGAVVETFPTQQFHLNMTGKRQVDRMAPEDKQQYRVVVIPVESLLPRHYDLIRGGLAQYLT